MTNEIGKTIFKRAGELNVAVGFMCMKVFFPPFALIKRAIALALNLLFSPLYMSISKHKSLQIQVTQIFIAAEILTSSLQLLSSKQVINI